jgi:hypothetical protein
MKENHSNNVSILTQIYQGALRRGRIDQTRTHSSKAPKLNRLQAINFPRLKKTSAGHTSIKGKNLKLHTSNEIDQKAPSATSRRALFCEGELQLYSHLQSLRVQDLEKQLHGRCRAMLFKEKIVAKKKMEQKMAQSSSLKRHVISDLSKK